MTAPSHLRLAALLVVLWFSHLAHADFAVAPSVLKPSTPGEAWNVIRLSTANVERLIAESRLAEVPVQISFSSPSLRALASLATTSEQVEHVPKLTERALGWVAAVARTGEANDKVATQDALKTLRKILDEIAKYYEPATVASDIFICPMHPDCIAPKQETPCPKCGMSTVHRRIPYSFIYTKPGEPSVKMTAKTNGPCEAGKPVEVTIRFSTQAGQPMYPMDFAIMHTQPIHLLIQTPDLSDYHHEHPVPTGEPGEYRTTFTPNKTLPYRVWADIVPTETGMQELPFVDLPSPGKPGPVENKETRLKSSAGGYNFELTIAGGNHIPIVAGQMRRVNVMVTDAQGQGVTKLEPVMQAFAHLVGFYEDFQSLVHLHPGGGEVTRDDMRGGPGLGFQFFAPKAGFLRLYCQVSIEGKMLFAPFDLTIAPGATEPK